MRIRSLTMKDFRGFEDATLDLDRPLTVLFGVNGSGKSSVLAAAAMASLQRRPQDTDIRLGASELTLTATLSHRGGSRRTVVRGTPNGSSVEHDGLLPAGPYLIAFYDESRSLTFGTLLGW